MIADKLNLYLVSNIRYHHKSFHNRVGSNQK